MVNRVAHCAMKNMYIFYLRNVFLGIIYVSYGTKNLHIKEAEAMSIKVMPLDRTSATSLMREKERRRDREIGVNVLNCTL